MKSNNFIYFLKESIMNIFLNGIASTTAVSIITACLVVMGTFFLVALNIDNTITVIEKDNEIVAFIEDELDNTKTAEINKKISQIQNVSQILYVTKEEALKQYKEELGNDGDVLSGLENDNPLRNSYHIKLKDLKLLAGTVEALKKIDGVAYIRERKEVAQGIIDLRNICIAIAFTIAIILGTVAVFIIGNTVRLAAFSRRDEIAIMKMVGATNWFIRYSFIIEGILLALIGSIIAYFIQWAIYSKLIYPLISSTPIIQGVAFNIISLFIFLSFLAFGALIGILGSFLSIQKFLKV